MNKIPTTVEAQIRTRARNLPIYKCYVNKDWQQAQKAIVLIVRKHTNGNITLGNFFVDLKLRGIKDCMYIFNESPLRMDEALKRFPGLHEECDYNLAHNIIHAGIEFAGDYGFEPHKNFKTAQFILDEDTEDIPLMEIPLGDNGLPVLEIPDGENCLRELTILEKTAGTNYRIVRLDKNGKPIPKERSYQEIMNEVMESGFEDLMGKDPDSRTDTETRVVIDLLYISKMYTEDDLKQIDEEVEHIIKDQRLTMSFEPDEEYTEDVLEKGFQLFVDGKIDEAYSESLRVIDEHPGNPLFWHILLSNLAVESDIVHEEAVNKAYSRFPDNPTIKAWYAEWLAQEERFDEVFDLFQHQPGLDALSKEMVAITAHALESFCYAYAAAWLSKGDIRRAEPYYLIISRLDYNYRIGGYIQERMEDLKREILTEIYDAKEPKNDLE